MQEKSIVYFFVSKFFFLSAMKNQTTDWVPSLLFDSQYGTLQKWRQAEEENKSWMLSMRTGFGEGRKEKRKWNNYIRMISTISNKKHLFSFSIEKYIWAVILCSHMIYKRRAIGFGKVAHIILAGTSFTRSYCLIFRYSHLCCCMT